MDSAFQVGAISIRLRTNSSAVMAGYEQCCRAFATPTTEQVDVVIDAIRCGSRDGRDRRYEISGNGRRRTVIRHFEHVLPHLEWTCNWAVALDCHRFLQVHAACVSRGAGGVLLGGKPEAGKTTLAAALTLGGWQYLCDEFALIDPATGLLQPFPKALNVKAGSAAVLNKLSPHVGIRLSRRPCGKGRVAVLPVDRIRAGAVSSPVPLRTVVFPTYRAGAPGMLREISPADALMRLGRLSFNFHQHGGTGVELLARLLRDTRCFEMESGTIRGAIEMIERATENAAVRRVA